MRDMVSFSGSLQPRSRITIAPKAGGRLERLYVDIGDRVRNGQLIAVLDGEEYAQQVDQARADLTVAEANLEDSRIALEAARRELEQMSALREKKIASAAEYDQAADALSKAEARHKVVQAQLRQKQSALEAARTRSSYARVTADWQAGGGERVIGERFVDEGTLLRANDPIVSVLDIEVLLALINVTEQSYARVRVGQPAAVASDALPGRRFAGRVARIAPFLQEASRQAEVRIEVPNPDGALKPGMFVQVELELGRREEAVTVPVAALARYEDRNGVFLVEGEPRRARFVPVTTGITDGERVEVLEPPLAGTVVTLGQHLLLDGSPVLLPGQQPPAQAGAEGQPPQGGKDRTPQGGKDRTPEGGSQRPGGGGRPEGATGRQGPDATGRQGPGTTRVVGPGPGGPGGAP
jgi:RND family efflux transporter MFP subunit